MGSEITLGFFREQPNNRESLHKISSGHRFSPNTERSSIGKIIPIISQYASINLHLDQRVKLFDISYIPNRQKDHKIVDHIEVLE